MQIEQKKEVISKKQIVQKFASNGYTLRPNTLELIQNQDLELIIKNLKLLFKSENILDEHHIKEAIGLQNQSINKDLQFLLNQKMTNSLVVLNSITDYRKISFQKGNIIFQQQQGQYFGSAKDQIEMQLNRFLLIKEKMKKNNDYCFQFENKLNASFPITDIISVGQSSEDCYTFGILQEKENKIYHLQDQYSSVELDLSICQNSIGFVNPGFIYICKGHYSNKFIVEKFIHPKFETKQETIVNFGSQDYFGSYDKIQSHLGKMIQIELQNLSITDTIQAKKIKKLSLEQQKYMGIYDLTNFANKGQDNPIIFISDFMIQKPEVLLNFNKILDQIQLFKPIAFVFMGSFTSFSDIKDFQDQQSYEQGFQHFFDILDNYPNLVQNCCFIFIPSPNDLGLGIIPQKQAIFQEDILEKLEKKIPYFINGSNPCRLSLFGKDIIILKNNILKEMRKNQIIQPNNANSLDQHLVITVLSQMILYYPNLYNSPLYLQFLDSLQIFQIPDYLVLCDSLCSQYKQDIGGCLTFNPGNFQKNGNFCVVRLQQGQIDCCEI